jgi:hydrogenase expression/formation protein HypD
LNDAYAAFDAEKKFGLADHHVDEPAECLSGLVCRDKSNRTNARPSAPAAPRSIRWARPMVSSEGACAAYYRYRRQPAEAGK